jgi:hypothetical protein
MVTFLRLIIFSMKKRLGDAREMIERLAAGFKRKRLHLNLTLSKERSAPTEDGAGSGAEPANAPTRTRLTAMQDTDAALRRSPTF